MRRNRGEAVALEAFEKVVKRLDAVENDEIQWPIAMALMCRGRLSMIQNQLESVLSTLGEVVESLVG